MILRRIASAVCRQDWATVLIEFALVIFGVLIALQVNNWNEARLEQEREQAALDRLAHDFSAILSSARLRKSEVADFRDNLDIVIQSVALGEVAEEERLAFEDGLRWAQIYRSLTGRSAMYVELLSAGNLALIGDDGLRAALAGYDEHVTKSEAGFLHIRSIQTANAPAFIRYFELSPTEFNREWTAPATIADRGTTYRALGTYDFQGMQADGNFRRAAAQMREAQAFYFTWHQANVVRAERVCERLAEAANRSCGTPQGDALHSNHDPSINLNDDTLEIDGPLPDGKGALRRLMRFERFDSPSPDLSKLTGLNDPRHTVLSSKVVGRDYQLFVRLPEDHDPDGAPYPVVYLLDGDITFPMLGAYERYLSFYGETPDVILVGIGYGVRTRADGNRRTFDYTVASPTRDDTGGAESFQKMLETEVLPLIEGACNADPVRRIIFGQSLGGQFVLYTALTRPDLFWGHIASNPAIQDNPSWFSQFGFEEDERTASRLFVVSGSDERERYAAPLRAWQAHWIAERAKPWLLKTAILDGHSHVSIGPAAYRAGMAWLFKAAGEEE